MNATLERPTVLLVDAHAAAIAAGVKPATIRKRLQRGTLTHHGYDHAGRALVDLHELRNLKSA